ncbi:uncharacterized protein AAES06_007344 isoform 1-T1 [Glossophaga mutica]
MRPVEGVSGRSHAPEPPDEGLGCVQACGGCPRRARRPSASSPRRDARGLSGACARAASATQTHACPAPTFTGSCRHRSTGPLGAQQQQRRPQPARPRQTSPLRHPGPRGEAAPAPARLRRAPCKCESAPFQGVHGSDGGEPRPDAQHPGPLRAVARRRAPKS